MVVVPYRQRSVDGFTIISPEQCLDDCVDMTLEQIRRYQDRLPSAVIDAVLETICFKPTVASPRHPHFEVTCREYPQNGTPQRTLHFSYNPPSPLSADYYFPDKVMTFYEQGVENLERIFHHELAHGFFKLFRKILPEFRAQWHKFYQDLCHDVLFPQIRIGNHPVTVGDELLSSYAFVVRDPPYRGVIISYPGYVGRVVLRHDKTQPHDTEIADVHLVHPGGEEFFCEAFDWYVNRPNDLAHRLPEAHRLMERAHAALRKYSR